MRFEKLLVVAIEIVEHTKDWQPPINARKRGFGYRDCAQSISSTACITLTTHRVNRSRRRKKPSIGANEKFNALGFYSQAWHGQPARLNCSSTTCIAQCPAQ